MYYWQEGKMQFVLPTDLSFFPLMNQVTIKSYRIPL